MAEDNRLLPVPSIDQPSPLQPRDYRRDYRYNNSYGADPLGEKNYLREYANIILKRKWIILSIVLIVTSASALYMYRIPSWYESQTTILIERKPTASLETKEITINMSDDPTYWATQLRLLANPELMRNVVIKLNLHNNPAFDGEQMGPGLWSAIKGYVSGKGQNATAPSAVPVVNDSTNVSVVTDIDKLTPEQREKVDGYASAILSGLSIEPIDGTNLVTLKYTHTRPEMAMIVVEGVAKVFIENNYKQESYSSEKNKEDVAKTATELKQKIEKLEEERLAVLRGANIPLGSEKGVSVQLEKLSALSGQYLDAENQLKLLRASYTAAASSRDRLSVPEVQADKDIQDTQKRISELEEKRDQLLVKYTDQHPEVLAIKEQINRAKDFLNKAVDHAISSLKARYEAAQKRRDELYEDYQRELSKANVDGQVVTRLGTLNQEIETTKQLYNQVIQRQVQNQIGDDGKAQNNIKIANPAKMPLGPVGPQRSRSILIAFLLSLFGGIGLAFLLDFIDDSLKSMDDVSRYLQLPTLALIPHSREDRKLFLRSKNKDPLEGNSTALVTMEDVKSPLSEAYRHLRTSLLFSSAGRPPKTILITSGQPMEGKTTTAINTAITLAQTGADVLIVDCDLRRPRVHAYFGMENEKGITNYLSGERDLAGLIQVYDKLPSLKVLACGPISPNPAELLGSEEMRGLLETVKESFTHIVIDTPPVLSFTDAAILSTQADGVLIVAMSGRSSRALVRRVKQRLTDVGARIFGVVLNGMRANSGDYGYGYYGGYYSRYYAEGESSSSSARR